MKKDYLFFSNIILLTIFILIPLDLIIKNFNMLFPFKKGFILIYFINIFLLISLNSFIYFFLKKFLNNKIFCNFLLFVLIWIILNGLFFPSIGEKSEWWDLISNIRLRYQLIFKFIFCILIYILILKKAFLKNNIKKILSIYTLFVLLFSFINIFILIQKPKENIDLKKFGKNNILVVSFDGINGNVIKDVIKSTKQNQFNFKDFALYPNYIVTFPATVNSIQSELTHETRIRNFDLKELLINKNDMIDRTYTYGSYNDIFLGSNKIYKGSFFIEDKVFFLKNLYIKYVLPSISRWTTFYFYKMINNHIEKNPILFVKIIKLLSFDFINYAKFDKKLDSTDLYRIGLLELDLLFNKFKFDRQITTNNIYFFHLTFSHVRVRNDENCDPINFDDRVKFQSFYGNKQITKCVIKKMNFVINKLKKENLYDDTTIIFKSDHGKPIRFHKSKKLNLKINDNPYWSAGRYNSFFMYKDKNKYSTKIEIRDKIIMSNDIYNFYCKTMQVKSECKNIMRNHIYIPKNKDTFLNLEDFEIFKMNRNSSLADQLLFNKKINYD